MLTGELLLLELLVWIEGERYILNLVEMVKKRLYMGLVRIRKNGRHLCITVQGEGVAKMTSRLS